MGKDLAGLALPLRAVNVSNAEGFDLGWCAVDANGRVIGYCMTEAQARQLVAPFAASHALPNAPGDCPHGMQTGGTPKAPCALCEADRLSSLPSTTPQKRLPEDVAICRRQPHGERSIGWVPLGREAENAMLDGLFTPSATACRNSEAFTVLGLVEWLQRWWKRDAAWRESQQAQLGPDVAHLMRGVADMIEQNNRADGGKQTNG
jgi:hypothetical protein